jgi:6-phosphogluconolactonase
MFGVYRGEGTTEPHQAILFVVASTLTTSHEGKTVKNIVVVLFGVLLALLTGCQSPNDAGSPRTGGEDGSEESSGVQFFSREQGPAAVYTMSNATSGNSVLIYQRAHNGALTPDGSVSTGGLGSGGGLGNQGGLILRGRYLFAVNAGSDEVSVLSVNNGGLSLVSRVPSGGVRPVSVAVHNDLVYVLNAGGSGNISGFRLAPSGALLPLAGSTLPLSSPASGPAQIEFTPSGRGLIVTEKATNNILSYAIDEHGRARGPLVEPSAGLTPFGFAFSNRGDLIVSDAFGAAAGQSALSSYHVGRKGGISLITGPVGNGQAAACWVVVTGNGEVAYTTNAASGTISSYGLAHNGGLTVHEAIAANLGAGSTPIDMALSNNSRFLYVLNAGAHTIGIFRVNIENGGLTPLGAVSGIPAGANGLAAR